MTDTELTGPDAFAEIVTATRTFIARELEPQSDSIESTDRLPSHIRNKMASLGYFGLTIPTEYGGIGLGARTYCAVVTEFGRTHSAFYQLIDDNNGMGSHQLIVAGNSEQRGKYLPAIARGELLTAFALTEPEAGSDAASIRTTARRCAQGYVLNGTKHFISNADRADLFTVIARTASDHENRQISAFLVPRESAGFTIGRRQEMMGLRGSAQHELIFDDCVVPMANRLGDEGDGFAGAKKALQVGRLAVAAWSLGAAQRAFELGLAYAAHRVQFGHAIGQFQGVQWLLAESATELLAARSMLTSVAYDVDHDNAKSIDCSMVKLFVTEAAGRVADQMLQVHGGIGYCKDVPIERIYRDIRVQRIIEGTSEIQKKIIAEGLLREEGMTR